MLIVSYQTCANFDDFFSCDAENDEKNVDFSV